MNEVIAWAGFAGAWLLVAGPLWQGSVELDELELDRAGIEGVKASAVRTAEQQLPSAWWWLLPPVMYVLRRRRNRSFRRDTLAQLSEAQREQFTSFRNKATGWFTVAAGATLLAAESTWSLVEHYRWPLWLFWFMLVAMLALSTLNTAIRMIRHQRARQG